MIAYFRLSVNPDDDEALRRIINYPARGIGETTLKKLQTFASEKKVSLWKALNDETIALAGFNKGTLGKLQRFVDLIKEFITDNEVGSNAFEVGQLIYNRTGVLTALAHDNTPEGISRQENLSEILAGLKDFVDLREQAGEGDRDMRAFLSEVMLSTDQDSTDDDNLPKVTLMTVHAAKGLEFKHIFVAGVEEELFPSSMSQDSLAQIEEERRLLYVAITRAKVTCTLTYASSRFRNGQTVMTRPSRFLGDIDTRYLHMQMSNSMGLNEKPLFIDPTSSYDRFSSVRDEGATSSKSGYERTQLSQRGRLSKIGSESAIGSGIAPLHTASEIEIGTQIHHDRYGKGVITHISQISGEVTITVDFGVVGIKKLLLKFAKFKIIG